MNSEKQNLMKRNKQIVESLCIQVPFREFRGKEIGQAGYIAPLQPSAFAAFPPWRIEQELIV